MNYPYTVFNYETQKWTEGQEAKDLRIQQIKADLEALQGVNGQKYFNMCKAPSSEGTREQAIEALREELESLTK